MRRLQHNAAAGAVAVDSLQLVTAELAEEVGARQVHRAVAVFRRHFALGLLAHAQNRVEQKRERREARDEQHSGFARLRLARRRSSVDQAHARACFSLQSLQSPADSAVVACVTYSARAPASVIFFARSERIYPLRARLRSFGVLKADEGKFSSRPVRHGRRCSGVRGPGRTCRTGSRCGPAT